MKMRRGFTKQITDWFQFDTRLGKQTFSSLHSVHIASRVHPAPYAIDIGASFPEVKRMGREANHSLHIMPRSRMAELDFLCLIYQTNDILGLTRDASLFHPLQIYFPLDSVVYQ
jgi:hypothetical protein